MPPRIIALTLTAVIAAAASVAASPDDGNDETRLGRSDDRRSNVQLGPRPFFLIYAMIDGPLKQELMACTDGPFKRSDFSIGHRGAPLQFPEHTVESYIAAARMGAGRLECDVVFTKDRGRFNRSTQQRLPVYQLAWRSPASCVGVS